MANFYLTVSSFILFLFSISAFDVISHYKTNSATLNPLKTDIELLIIQSQGNSIPEEVLSNPYFANLKKLYDDRSVSALQSAIKSHQRFVLQLDRSDGRPDIDTNTLATKYYDFVATCLRSEKSSWTAALGPLEFVGLHFKNHIEDKVVLDSRFRIINLSSLCHSMCNCLLDIDTKDPDKLRLLLSSEQSVKSSIIDLSLSLARLALRYAIFKDKLSYDSHRRDESTNNSSGDPLDNFGFIEILLGTKSDLDEIIIPSSRRIDTLLHLDLLLPEEDLPIPGSSRIILRKKDLSSWIDKNPLE